MNTSSSLRHLTALVLAAIAGFSSQAVQATPAQVDASLKSPQAKYVASELLVQFRPGVKRSAQVEALRAVQGTHGRLLRAAARQGGELHQVRLPAGKSVVAAMKALRKSSAVAFVEPNWVYTTQAVSNDPMYINGQQWGAYGAATPLQTNMYGSGAATAWENGNVCSKREVIAVIDEGVQIEHKDLLKRIFINPGEIADDGMDNDGNGLIDDVNGYDFVNEDASVFDSIDDDHGTMVAGIITGKGDNSRGMSGVCWEANVLPVKFMVNGTGSAADAVRAVDYVTDMKLRTGESILAINASWGGQGFSQSLKDAITRANDAGILFIAAAGNGGANIDPTPFYPASYDVANVIAVGALTANGALANFSNWGPNSVHIAAPGNGIWTTVPFIKDGEYKYGYAAMSGTSWAAAFVSGAAALYSSDKRKATAADIKAAILGTSIPTPALEGKIMTGGRLDVSTFWSVPSSK